MLNICMITSRKSPPHCLWLAAFTLFIISSLSILPTTLYATASNTTDNTTCQAGSFVDPLYPEFGDIVLVTRNLPQGVSTYQEAGQQDSGVTHWHVGEAGLTWAEDGEKATLQGEIVNNYNHEQSMIIGSWTQAR